MSLVQHTVPAQVDGAQAVRRQTPRTCQVTPPAACQRLGEELHQCFLWSLANHKPSSQSPGSEVSAPGTDLMNVSMGPTHSEH